MRRTIGTLAVMSMVVACGGDDAPRDASAQLLFGVYLITAGHDQGTTRPWTLTVPETFTVAETADGIRLTGARIFTSDTGSPSVPWAGTQYHWEKYYALLEYCEGGGTSHCAGHYAEITVTVPATGYVHVEEYFQAGYGSCGTAPPCDDSLAQQLVGPLVADAVPRVIDGMLQ